MCFFTPLSSYWFLYLKQIILKALRFQFVDINDDTVSFTILCSSLIVIRINQGTTTYCICLKVGALRGETANLGNDALPI